VRSRTYVGMARRALPALLVASAALADAAGEPALALYALLAAVPALAIAALTALGDMLDGDAVPRRQLQALLWVLASVLAVGGAAVRGPAVRDADLPAFAGSALIACLVALALEAAVAAAHTAVERPPRRHHSETHEELREAA
jgi:hypothetical protein